jgi:hypothetical protein
MKTFQLSNFGLSDRQTGRVPGEPGRMNLIGKRLAALAATASILAIGVPVAGASAAVPVGLTSHRVAASAPQARSAVTDSGPTIIGPRISGGTVTQGLAAGLQFSSTSAPQAISLLSSNAGGTVASGR